MPIALIPDGFTLKKVTAAQEQALKDHRKHEDFKAFLGSSGSGKGLGLGALGIVLLLILPFMILSFIKKYGEDNPNTTFSQFSEEAMKDKEGWGAVAGGTAVYAKALAGIPESLQNVIIPEPIRDEIKARTGFDVDVANVFEPLFGAILQKQKED